MNRRSALRTLVGAGLGLSVAARTLAANKPPRIGYLVLSPLVDPPTPERAAFLEGLRALGYQDGKNVIIEYRSAEGDADRLPFLAEELVANRVDIIVAAGGDPAIAARNATRTIPIVMLFTADPILLGLVSSLSRPGGNVTGMSLMGPEIGAKRLELLKEAVPTIKRVALLWDSNFISGRPEYDSIVAAARHLGVRLYPIDIKGVPLRIEEAFNTLIRIHPDAMIISVGLRVFAYSEFIPEFVLHQRIPAMFWHRSFAVAGGLLSYAPSYTKLARRAASFVDKILKGANPAELPVEQPVEFELVVNLKTARALGITMPQTILVRADEVLR